MVTKKNDALLDALEECELKKLERLALQYPKCNGVFIKEFQEDPEFAKDCIHSELEAYSQTGESKYLLSALKDVAIAKSWGWLAKETGLSRTTLYETLNGKSLPRIDTLVKILNALGFRMLFVPVDNTKATTQIIRKKTSTMRTQRKKQLQHA